MMRALALLALPLIAACGQEPDFDERYEKIEQSIEETAAKLDEELEETRADAASGDEQE